ncbi:hypothetical protein ACRQ5Q_13415 [Bradyrhizobium sp. PMVTL-01]|uniref:hypothetical protein n=1 Tax=Bradyrhizobium sp. PMVTL-01 TaxID=3434999 RepID=UPI003F70DDB7
MDPDNGKRLRADVAQSPCISRWIKKITYSRPPTIWRGVRTLAAEIAIGQYVAHGGRSEIVEDHGAADADVRGTTLTNPGAGAAEDVAIVDLNVG